MRTFTCTYEQCRELQRSVNGTFYLYPDWNKNEKTKNVLIGRKMPNGRVFIGYGQEIEMYGPGEYEEVAE
jgi:hypothetical protein